MVGERGRLNAVQRAEAKRDASLTAIAAAAQEQALEREEAGGEQTPAARALQSRLRVRLAQLRDVLAETERELVRLAGGTA